MADRSVSRPSADLSRRSLLRFGAAGAALPALGHVLPAAAAPVDPALAEPAAMLQSLTDGVFINANENPLGPGRAARAALAGIERLSGRYGMAFAGRLQALFARQNGLRPENVVIHPGSFVPLRAVALAFSSADRPIAYAEPTFDQGFLDAAGRPLTRVVGVPLAGDYAGDVRALHAAAPQAGLYYVCNPNNPTGLVTTRADIEWLLANKPRDAVLLVDEAYIHYSDTARSCLDLVAQGADVLVTRTFSKIYGLAGLRCGLVAGRKDLLDRIAGYAINIPPMPAVVAAEASLLDPALVPERKAYNRAVRADLFRWLDARGLRYLPSQTSFAMVQVGRPGEAVAAALARRGVHISGPRTHMPDWVRVSFGTPQEMEQFKTAFLAVLAPA